MNVRIILLAVLVAGCADDFDPYNVILEPRLLAIQADPPALHEGEQTELAALVTDDSATIEWRWCPLSGGVSEGLRCLVTQPQLQAIADEAFGEGQVTVPPYDLGSGETASFSYDIPAALLQGVCDFLRSEDAPELPTLPSCDGQYEIEIHVRMTAGDQEILGMRDVALLFDDQAPVNQLPEILGARAVAPGGDVIDLPEGSAAQLERDVEYRLELDIPESSSETYTDDPIDGPPEEVREDLIVTWFYEGGDMDKQRSSFLEGEIGFDVLRTNLWTTPLADELPETATRLYFVLRDDRGGTAWLVREIDLEAP